MPRSPTPKKAGLFSTIFSLAFEVALADTELMQQQALAPNLVVVVKTMVARLTVSCRFNRPVNTRHSPRPVGVRSLICRAASGLSLADQLTPSVRVVGNFGSARPRSGTSDGGSTV